jgi:hypothetical protein
MKASSINLFQGRIIPDTTLFKGLINNTFGDNKIGDQIECRGTVYMRLTGEEDAASQKPIVSGLEPSLSPVVMINGLRLDGTWGEPGRIFRQPSIRARGI